MTSQRVTPARDLLGEILADVDRLTSERDYHACRAAEIIQWLEESRALREQLLDRVEAERARAEASDAIMATLLKHCDATHLDEAIDVLAGWKRAAALLREIAVCDQHAAACCREWCADCQREVAWWDRRAELLADVDGGTS